MQPNIRSLTIADLDQCVELETSAFPPNEASSREKIEYRLTVAPELCYGLFLPAASPTKSPVGTSNNDGASLVAHIIATKTTSSVVTDQDMAVPKSWKQSPKASHSQGHQVNGRTIALHSLAVSPKCQKGGFGRTLVESYIDRMSRTRQADAISLLTYDRLVNYYEKLGFRCVGKSQATFAGIEWNDLVIEIKRPRSNL